MRFSAGGNSVYACPLLSLKLSSSRIIASVIGLMFDKMTLWPSYYALLTVMGHRTSRRRPSNSSVPWRFRSTRRNAVVRDDACHELAVRDDPYALELSAALLRQAKADVAKDGAGFIVVEVPFRRHETNKLAYSTTDLQPPALWDDVKLISPVDAMTKAMSAGAEVYYENGEGHFSPLGAKMLTDIVLGQIDTNPHLAHCKRN